MKQPNWLNDEQRRKKKDSIKQEKRWAKELDGEKMPASGALMGKRGDVTKDKFLFELKETKNESFSIKLSTWRKITKQSFPFKIPLLGITLQGVDLIVMSRDTFMEMLALDKK